jgi:hypothetical protein
MSASTLRRAAALKQARADAGYHPTEERAGADLFETIAQVGPAHGGREWDAAVTFARVCLGQSA